MRQKYHRPITDIYAEITSLIPKTMQAKTVTANGDGTQTLYVCDTLYAQKGFTVTIAGAEYEITAFDPDAGTITVSAGAVIPQWTIFDLYSVYFFHGTPSTTQTEINKITNSFAKTPMIWIWERFKEKIYTDQDPERDAFLEWFALTQPPKKLAQMTHAEKQTECVIPMRKLAQLVIALMYKRTDLFFMDDYSYEMEDQHDFAIEVRSKGADRAIFMDNLSGVGIYALTQFSYKDSCPCPPPYTPTPATPWILATGYWNDAGVWIDTSAWID